MKLREGTRLVTVTTVVAIDYDSEMRRILRVVIVILTQFMEWRQ